MNKAEVQDAWDDLLDDVPATSEFEALTDLFLEDTPPPTSSPAQRSVGAGRPHDSSLDEAPRAMRVETLIMGHLPTLAGAWAAQYARHAFAAERRPVMLLRDAAGSRTLEALPASRCPEASGARSADDAVARSAMGCSRIVVRTDEIDEPDLIHASEGCEVTLLTGADDAAIVSAYRTIKQLFGGTGEPGRTVGVAVMGAPEPRARESFARLQRAARTFLAIDLTLAAVCPSLTAEPASLVWRGERPGRDYADLLTRLRQVRPVSAPAPAQSYSEPKRTAPRAESPLRSAYAGAGECGWDSCDLLDLPAVAHAPVDRAPATRELLKGVRAVELRCPVAAEIALGVDHAGRLHLIAEDRSASPLEGLSAAAEWATENFELLSLAIEAKGLTAPRAAQRPLLHAVTRSPSRAKQMLRCGVRVHVMADVDIDGRVATACIDLE